jgi:SAM-dependent methyltransferase
MTVTYEVGDGREVVKTLSDGSVDLVCCSPPFLALRSYLAADHEMKGKEIGSEQNPAAFIDTLLELTAEWGRVLAPHGSIAIELGDTYSGSGDTGWHRAGNEDPDRYRSLGAVASTVPQNGVGWPRAKSLALIPQLYAVALAYGINPLTGQPSPAGRWLVRNVIVWHRPNPAVGALGDKVRPSTSYIVVATRSAKRWFDLTAVRGPVSENTHQRLARGVEVAPRNGKSADRDGNYDTMPELATTAGAPPLDAWFDEYDYHDTWTLTTQPSSLSHYAMWPAKLAERLVLMMCPREVCRVCGEPRRRVETASYVGAKSGREYTPHVWQSGNGDTHAHGAKAPDEGARMVPITTGWTDCGCACPTCNGGHFVPCPNCGRPESLPIFRECDEHLPRWVSGRGGAWEKDGPHDRWEPCPDCTDGRARDFRPGLALDPFCGTGTTLAVADLHGRDAIGIDIDERNKAIYPARYDEVKRALFGTPAPMPGQGVLL